MQILGAEAEARVPAEFIVQQPDSANPPTLFLVLAQMADDFAASAAQPGGNREDMQHQEEFLRAGSSFICLRFELVLLHLCPS